MTNTLHAHVSTASADCDGPVFRSYVMSYNDDEIEGMARAINRGIDLGYGADCPVNDFSEIDFRNRVLTSCVSVYSVAHGLRMTATDAGFEWHEDTEEGYRSGEVTWCHDDCDLGFHRQRDMYAEAMNY